MAFLIVRKEPAERFGSGANAVIETERLARDRAKPKIATTGKVSRKLTFEALIAAKANLSKS